MTGLYEILKKRMLMPIVFLILFAMAFMFDPIDQMWTGYLAILKSPSVLISDYLYIGGLGATLFNVATIMLINVVMLSILKLKMTGPIFAGLLTIAGFSFFGKNVFNTIPIYLGIYLYAKTQRLDFKSFIIVVLFSTGISPIVSFTIFGTGWHYWIGVPAGIVLGLITGFVLPALTANTIKFHMGYNLYNVGFAMGILAMLYTAFFTSLGISTAVGGPASDAFHNELMLLTIVLSLVFIFGAFFNDKEVHKKYSLILKSTGRAVSDFISDAGKDVTMLNVGILGLICAAYVWVLPIKITGPLMGGILTVMGFGAFGKHPRNCIPVMLGALLAVLITNYDMKESVGIAIALLFVTAIAPIAGRFGFFVGILAGAIHIIITPLSGAFQGGFDLYNNGFAAGFVAALMVPVLDFLIRDKTKTEVR